MYAKNILIDNDCWETEQTSNEHDFVLFGSLKASVGTECRYSLDDIFLLLTRLSEDAVDYGALSENEFNAAKISEVEAAVFSYTEGNERKCKSFVSRSLACVDVDQKNIPNNEIVDYPEIVEFLDNLALDGVVYTTISYRPSEPCFRILVNLGKVCGEEDFHKACAWLDEKLKSLLPRGSIDEVSWRTVHPMLLPSAFRYHRPVVRRVKGLGIWDTYNKEVEAKKVTIPKAHGKKAQILLAATNKVELVDDLFNKHVGTLHKSLVFYQHAGGSLQYWRNTSDRTPGLYCKNYFWNIFDPSKWKNYPLQYRLQDFIEARHHVLPSREDVVEAVDTWIKSDVQYALLHESCGTGKSEVLSKLSTRDPSKQRYIFTFHTLQSRDAFLERASSAVVVKGIAEIIEDCVGDRTRRRKVLQYIDNQYNAVAAERNAISEKGKEVGTEYARDMTEYQLALLSQKYKFEIFLEECKKQNLLTQSELDHILGEYSHNKNLLLNRNHLLMTTRKLECILAYSDPNIFSDDIIFTDEHQVGMLTNIDRERAYCLFGSVFHAKQNDDFDRTCLHTLKRCIVTSESAAEKELINNNIGYTRLSCVSRILDLKGLEILWVPSTSMKMNNGKTVRGSLKAAIEKVKGEKFPVIVDNLDSPYNMTNNKGSNELRNNDTAVILSEPCPQQIANYMAATGLDEEDAKALIMSDNANQAIGRNQGYRNIGSNGKPGSGKNHCLLIVRGDVVNLKLHNVTTKVVKLNDWKSDHLSRRVPDQRKNEFYFRDVIDEIALVLKK